MRSVPCQAYVLPKVPACNLCFAKRFPYEPTGSCYCKGDVSLYPISVSNQLKELFLGSTPECAHFRQFIRPFNSAFAFTSIGVVLNEKYATKSGGMYTFRAQGQICHYIHNLYLSESHLHTCSSIFMTLKQKRKTGDP